MLIRKALNKKLFRPFCIYSRAQDDLYKNLSFNNSSVDKMRSDFSQLRELQRRFFYNINEKTAVDLFKVKFFALSFLEIERYGDA